MSDAYLEQAPRKIMCPSHLPASAINREFVLDRCSTLVDFQLWPIANVLDAERWLTNFQPDELPYALHLLNSFVYLSEPITNQIFRSAFHNLSNIVLARSATATLRQQWNSFLDNVIVTYVEGEVPNATDSGYSFARKARQVLGISEDRIMAPKEALSLLYMSGPRPVVFVDDFVGSGNQFGDTWCRMYELLPGYGSSFKHYAAGGRGKGFYYCPAICTEYGQNKIASRCPEVVLSPGNILTSQHSALSAKTLTWPADMRIGGIRFIRNASKRAGIPDQKGAVNDWRGFHKLGLTLAFSHSTPDATLPIFYWKENGWRHLIERT